MKSPMNVAIIHPDLGLGGAERLILDVALALKARKHNVKIFTGYHDKKRCFVETRDGTLDVVVAGTWIPRTLAGRLHALLAYVRMIWIALYLIYWSHYKFDLVICDQVSACIPFLRLLRKSPIIFYCHFPDQLLTDRKTWLKRIYRAPLDWFEQFTTGLANLVLVNSRFTANVFRETFTMLTSTKIHVLYPCVNLQTFDSFKPDKKRLEELKSSLNDDGDQFILLSLNRYERKKNLELSIKALKILVDNNPTSRPNIHLIIAGGYDQRLAENCEYHKQLVTTSEQLELTANSQYKNSLVTFLKSPSDDEKMELLYMCDAVVYTPENEHFGIVPLEAMAMGKPVIACKSGGPLETVLHGQTGYLCRATPEEFAKAMALLSMPNDRGISRQMGAMAFQRVQTRFSFDEFSSKLINICQDLLVRCRSSQN